MAIAPRLSRRKRLLRLTVGVAVLGVAAAIAVVWVARRRGPVYRPGEAIEGLTAGLTRSLPPDHPSVTFVDVAREAGIAFRHFDGVRSSQLPEDMGSGVAWGDYDQDGHIDLFVVNTIGPLAVSRDDSTGRRSPARSALYRNNRDGTFTDVTDRAGIDHRGWGMAAAWGDYDNDGWPDLVVTAYGENTLYHNEGDGTFSDRSSVSGLGGRPGFWAGASWADYDRDGFLDLYVTGYVRLAPLGRAGTSRQYGAEVPASLNPSSFRPERNLLYHNNGEGSFREVAVAAGVSDTLGRGLSGAWCDFDEDGWPDLYVANDVSDNLMYRNQGDGTFADVSHAAMVADYRGAMGLAVGDWDGDGDQDIVVTHWIAQENALYNNQLARHRAAAPDGRIPPLQFMDEADRYGLGQIALDYIGWGTFFFDYDNDGKPDLFVVNGSTFQERDDPTRLVPMRDQLFWNRGPQEGFYDVSPASGDYFQRAYVGRGAAFADYDNDGDLDAFIVNNGGPGVLLRNEGGNRNQWLQVELRGTRSNRHGVGARLRLVAGGRTQVRQVGAQSSYLSQNSLIEHFGLGTHATADTLEIVWPSGVRERRTGLPAGRRIQVVEGDRPDSVATERDRIREFWQLYRAAAEHRVAGRTAAAAAAYAQALERDPDHEDALYYLGNMRLELGDFAAAEQAWRRQAAVNPGSARAHSQLGSLYLCLEEGAPFDPARAESEFERAHEINKEETGPLLRLGEVALLRGDHAAARRRLETVLGSHPASAPSHFYLGYLAWKAGDRDRARAAFGRAVAASPPPPAPAPGEGDTKRGVTPLSARRERCAALRDLLRPLETPPADSSALDLEMLRRYGALDQLVAQGRARPH
ncbi:MAG TPA: FG-GAP-like repeat-containing protein [Gemmatimonadales bacterium]